MTDWDAVWDEIGNPPIHFDRQGEPISMRRWAELFEDRGYQVVARTEVGGYFVSTIWLGLDHGFGRWSQPMIFESMVFESELSYGKPSEWFPKGIVYHRDFEQWRYSTEQAALAGHEELCEQVRLMIAATEPSMETCERQDHP
jgi:hypothetical protein